MDVPSLVLNSGERIPAIAFGTGTSFWNRGDDVSNVIQDSYQAGFRSYDGAAIYGTEEGLGKGLSNLGVPRSNLYVITKTPDWAWTQETIEAEVRKSLSRLRLEYLDLVLIHSPAPRKTVFDRLEMDVTSLGLPDPMDETAMDAARLQAWLGLQNCVKKGLVRDIGVSNFTVSHLSKLLKNPEVSIVPAVNQVEFNPYLVDLPIYTFCKEKDILIQAFAPLGNGKGMLDDPVLKSLAKVHGKTVGQIALRWAWQMGITTVTKTEKKERMLENLSFFDFNLSQSEIDQISNLNRNQRNFGDPAKFP